MYSEHTDRGLPPECTRSHTAQTTSFKMVRRLKTLNKEDTQLSSQHAERRPASGVIREVQVKTTEMPGCGDPAQPLPGSWAHPHAPPLQPTAVAPQEGTPVSLHPGVWGRLWAVPPSPPPAELAPLTVLPGGPISPRACCQHLPLAGPPAAPDRSTPPARRARSWEGGSRPPQSQRPPH